eukprot:3594533-Rhodomonas_salina.1
MRLTWGLARPSRGRALSLSRSLFHFLQSLALRVRAVPPRAFHLLNPPDAHDASAGCRTTCAFGGGVKSCAVCTVSSSGVGGGGQEGSS